MRIVVAVLLLVLSASLPVRADRTTFLGWHPSGAFFYRSTETGAGVVVQACRDDTSDVPAEWPDGVGIGPGAACGDLPAEVGGAKALDFVKKDTKGAKVDKKSPFGVQIALDGGAVIASDGPDKKETLRDIGATGGLKLADVQWRADGRQVAVTVEPDEKLKKGEPPAQRWLVVADVSKLLVGGAAGRKVAERAHAEGMKLYKKRDWSGAGRALDEAIAADAEWAPARYLRAAAEAQGGVGRTAMIENLQWLKDRAADDAQAKKLLAQAKGDAAFDAWVGEPEVRELLGLAAVATMDVPARLLERTGQWTLQGATCARPWLTLAFKKGGAATLKVAESCKGKKTTKSAPAQWKQAATGTFEVTLKKAPDGVTFPAQSTIVLDDSYQQLKLQGADGTELGTFEPGEAHLDDTL